MALQHYDEQHAAEAHHGPSVPTFNLIFVALVVITLVEVAAGEIGGFIGHVLLIGFTTLKGGLVVAYYMHLKYDPPILTWIFLVPLLMGVAVVLSMQGLAGY